MPLAAGVPVQSFGLVFLLVVLAVVIFDRWARKV